MEIPLSILVAGITHDGNYGTLRKRSQREEAERLGRTVNRHLSCWSRVAFRSELVAGIPSQLSHPHAMLAAQSSHTSLKPSPPQRQKDRNPTLLQDNRVTWHYRTQLFTHCHVTPPAPAIGCSNQAKHSYWITSTWVYTKGHCVSYN